MIEAAKLLGQSGVLNPGLRDLQFAVRGMPVAGSIDANLNREDLAGLELLRAVDLDAVAPLMEACVSRELDTGDYLIEAGEDNRYLYLVLSGCLSIRFRDGSDMPLTTVGAGESVGEVSLIDHKPASAFVMAEEPTRVLQVDEDLLWQLVNTSHSISANLLVTLAKRMRFVNDAISKDREQLKVYRFHATVDALTGLFNRYWLNKMLPRQMDRSWKQGEPMALVLLDVDHFKPYNDQHGHVAGDHALCAVATCLRDHLRPSDMAARFGGEEMLVLLPKSTVDDARVVAERLRAAVERTEISYPNGERLPSVTVSAGVAALPGPSDPEQFLEAVDASLYRAKRAGRNRVDG